MGCIKMTVKELKEKLECLIEEGIGDYTVLTGDYFGDSFEIVDIDINGIDMEVYL